MMQGQKEENKQIVCFFIQVHSGFQPSKQRVIK